jgi:N-acyl amino acid synthase of PEP-CTERM/exosortase system
MNDSTLGNALVALREEVSVELAGTPALLRQAHQLRYQVYCVERGFEAGQNGMERDEYDAFARHAVVRWRQTGEVVGTVRLIMPNVSTGGDYYPIQHVCAPALLRGLPLATCGEVSRFALAKEAMKRVRDISPASCALLRLALIRGAVWLSAEAGHTHWLAVMEPTLLRLLRTTGLHFDSLGPLIDYHGVRQPAVAELIPTLSRLAVEQPIVWDFVTRSGTWYPASRPRFSRVGPALAARPRETLAA